MREINEQQILALAPNAAAASNGKKISQKGGFVKLEQSQDDTFYMGECTGSGKSNYITSADYIDENNPVFRCSCPSRQFPCKHSLALLFEISQGKAFEECEIPEDILQKRQKKEARAKKTATEKKAGKPKANQAAQTKKIKKQLEGLKLAEEMMRSLLSAGLGTMGGASIKTYRDLAKQLGDYYLPGPQNYFNRLVLEMEVYQKDQDKSHYHQAVEVLKRLRALEKKAAVYLNGKLDTDSPEADDDILYEKLGGIWKLDQLEGLGLKKEHARLVQLSFQVIYDEARKEYIDIGYWADVDTGEISSTYNYRPVKALKYVKQEDSCFDVVNTPMLCYYPGGMNKRIRWENADFEPMDGRVLADVTAHAHREIQTAVKLAKNEMKNLLSEDYCGMLLRYERIGTIRTKQGDLWVLEDETGGRMELAGREGWEDTMTALSLISDPEVYRGQALFGLLYYDSKERRIRMYPCSIVTEKGIVRLLY